MAEFKVWSPDACDEEDADTVFAADAEDAAQDWARADHAEEPWDSISVHVRDSSGTEHTFEVTADWSLYFSVGRKP